MLKFLNFPLVVMMLKLTLAVAPTTHVLFLISSQDNQYHRQLGRNLRDDILRQSERLAGDYAISVRLVHEIFNHPGDWTLLTAMPHLISPHAKLLHGDNNTKWIVWCEESTHVRLPPLLDRLGRENHTQHLYLGHPLYDHEATIIHHFAYFENPSWFPYPMLRAGLIFTVPLFKSLASLVADARRASLPHGRTEFSIDSAHELARFIMDNVRLKNDKRSKDTADGAIAMGPHSNSNKNNRKDDANGVVKGLTSCRNDGLGCERFTENVEKVILRRASYVCPSKVVVVVAAPMDRVGAGRHGNAEKHQDIEECVMYAQGSNMTTCVPVQREQIYFAIKTCQRFHKERLPIIEATWGSYAIHKRYFSDVADASIPTVSCGVLNTETGHCAKTLAILKLAFEDIKDVNRQGKRKDNIASNIQWLFLTDDDTLLSISSLCSVLGCYNASAPIYLGERYGYRTHADDGFNYITGGGGIVLSLPTVQLILQHCSCPSPSAPDDMILGSCLHSLQVSAIHSSRFHQARPNDYNAALLELEAPVSFHKFWQLDPIATYRKWFQRDDLQLLRGPRKHPKVPAKVRVQNASHDYKTMTKQKPSVEQLGGAENIVKMQRSSLTSFDHAKENHMDL